MAKQIIYGEEARKMPEEVRSSAAFCFRTTLSAKGFSFMFLSSNFI